MDSSGLYYNHLILCFGKWKEKSLFPQLHTMYPHTNGHNLLEEASEHPSEMNKYLFAKIILKVVCMFVHLTQGSTVINICSILPFYTIVHGFTRSTWLP